MRRSIFYITFSTLIGIINCSSDSILAPESDLVVIQAYLYAGEPVTDVKIASTLPLGSEDVNAPPINDAAVTLIKEYTRYPLQPSPGDSGYYHYTGNDLSVQTGDIFRIEVYYNGITATGETIVPPPPEDVSISGDTLIYPEEFFGWQNSENMERSRLTLKWENDGNSLFFITVKNVDTNPEPVNESGFRFRGGFNFISRPTSLDSMRINSLNFTHLGRHCAKIHRINQEYADLYQSRNQDSRDLNEPLTNIINGLGVFSAFNSESLFFYVTRQ